MYVYTCTCGHRWACMRMKAKGQLQLSLLRWYPLSFSDSVSHWPGTCPIGYTAWPKVRNLLVIHPFLAGILSPCHHGLWGWNQVLMLVGQALYQLSSLCLPAHSLPPSSTPGWTWTQQSAWLCFSILLRYWDTVSTCLNWPWICCVVKNNLELLFSPKNYLLCTVFCGQVSHHSGWELNSGPVEVLLTSKSCLQFSDF